MTTEHPITPPPELVKELYGLPQMGAIEKAYQAGADQELEACLRLVEIDGGEDAYDFARYIRAARRSGVPHNDEHWAYEQHIATRAAQWGADQELEACRKFISEDYSCSAAEKLMAARRPKPQPLNSIALEMLDTIEKMDVVIPEITDTIRRALEALPND
jgi:hypothetical protein